MSVLARYTITIDGQDYYVDPGSFVEGAVRRQAEFAYMGEEDLKSRPDTREWLHNSWIGGAQWEKPVYGRNNQDTYFESSDLSFTDRAGAVQEAAELTPLDSDLGSPSAKLIGWSEDSVDGALAFVNTSGTTWQWHEWVASTQTWTAIASRTSTLGASDYVMAASAGADGKAYALMNTGTVAYYDPTANTNSTFTTRTADVYNGGAIWVSRDFVWVYDGDTIYNYDINNSYAESLVAIADDDDGLDVFSRSASWATKPIIPEWSCTRAISTSEGIFYVKNVSEGGLTVAKAYRLDKDASGSYILTPLGTLPKGQVALNLTLHLGSLLVSTVPNFHRAVVNNDDQRVTIYHITGKSIGAIGSPLGGTNIDESPVWFLGTYNEMLYFGGRRRLWMYDARVGAFHVVHEESATKYTDHGSGFTQMASVLLTAGAGMMFMHTSQDATSAAPYLEVLTEDSLITTANDTAYVVSNWFDFDVPLEQKSVHEIFYDTSNLRTNSTILIQLSADGGAFATVATLTGGTSPNTARIPVSSPVTGYKFQYKLVFSTDTVTSSAEPSRLYSLGFAAFGGEMVDVIQFTIDGKESVNMENDVQIPSDVYNLMATLRATKTEVSVTHSYKSDLADDLVTNTYRVTSVTGRKESPYDGMYEIQMVEVP